MFVFLLYFHGDGCNLAFYDCGVFGGGVPFLQAALAIIAVIIIIIILLPNPFCIVFVIEYNGILIAPFSSDPACILLLLLLLLLDSSLGVGGMVFGGTACNALVSI